MLRDHIRRTRPILCALAALCAPSSAIAHENHGDGEAAQVMTIAAVAPGGPAAEAGLIEGDRIVSWDGEHLRSQTDLTVFLDARRPGDVVPLEIDRNGETIGIELTLGDRGDGGPRLGVSLGVEAAGPVADGDNVTSDECRAWLDETYQVSALSVELGLGLEAPIAENRTCVDGDLAQMTPSIPRGWCDNVFKVHCSGLDLLAEIGDAIVDRCETRLSNELDFDLARDKTWNVCGEQRVFDAYSMEGRVSDAEACRSIFVDDCGAVITGSESR